MMQMLGNILAMTALVAVAPPAGLAVDPGAQAPSAFAGRWEFTYQAPAGRAGAGGGSAGGSGRGGAGATGAERTAILEITVAPSGALTGTLDLGPGRAPGNNPRQPVEIADVSVTDSQISFSAWQFDNYTNRVRYTASRAGDALTLTATRETSDGPERTEFTARRATP